MACLVVFFLTSRPLLCAVAACPRADQLGVIFVSRLVVGNVMEVVVPFIKLWCQRRKRKKDDKERARTRQQTGPAHGSEAASRGVWDPADDVRASPAQHSFHLNT